MFDPKYWKYCKGITVKQFCDYLQENIPPDALIMYVVMIRYICIWKKMGVCSL